jgi:DedD protein
MGLFSSGSKDAAPSRRSKAPADRSGEGRRTRGESRSQQDSLLDPTLPEKQRARQRLVGAIALVLAAVIGLPMVLDSRPRPASDDIAIDIPRVSKSATVQTALAPAPDQTAIATAAAPAKTPAGTASLEGAASKPAAGS